MENYSNGIIVEKDLNYTWPGKSTAKNVIRNSKIHNSKLITKLFMYNVNNYVKRNYRKSYW